MECNEERSSQNDQPNKLGISKKQKKKNEYDYHRKKRRGMDGSNSKKSGQRFTEEEDRLILQLVLNNGPKFQKIHRHFPGKTLAMVKNRYYKHLRFRWELLGQNYKHLSVPQEQLETLCEQQKKVSNILNAEKDDLITQITSRTTLLSNARMLVEYILVNYDSDYNSNILLEPKKLQMILTKNLNDDRVVKVDQQSETDDNKLIPIQLKEIKNPKFYVQLQQTKHKLDQQHVILINKCGLPMPPGINYTESEIFKQYSFQKIKEEKNNIEFNRLIYDDIHIVRLKTRKMKKRNNSQIIKLQGENENYYEIQRIKINRQQEAFFKVYFDVNQLKRVEEFYLLIFEGFLKQARYEQR
ncbi:unnamed protein product [Paramecium pentaurelia]|uniref:HTH myb-type domain-containing protein n=1 Tax=Paramecium pentaurelia TaxID=43138 RepID=A0A8S1Y0Z9_9CILI|nr:unnamed protein product [Paramecium pentaurelia]